MKTYLRKLLLTAALCGLFSESRAMDLTNGLMFAVPVANGKTPQIDGDLKDFDTSRAEPMWVAPQTINQYRANVAFMYDDDAIYIGAQVSLPGRALINPAQPTDAFWSGDLVQIRLGTDPALPYPLDGNRDKTSPRVVHLSLWKNTESGADFLHIGRGTGIDLGQSVNPTGSAIKIQTQNTTGYTVEARVPWAALGAPDGKNPYRANQKMTAIVEALWKGGDAFRVAANYRANPGTFAFMQPQTWGQIEFSPTGNLAPRGENIEQLMARFGAESAKKPLEIGVPFVVEVPAARRVSVNIFGPNGEVVRELMGGEQHPKGPLTLRWDGKDQWGQGVKPGNYRWGAYFSSGLKAQYVGGVGKSGSPYFETADGKGGWGADHSNPIDVAADASGLYFLWPVSESGKSVVKTDYSGKVLWRKTPFVGGGWGPLYALASDGKFVYLTLGEDKTRLVRLDAATGQLQTWASGGAELPVDEAPNVFHKPENTPLDHTGANHGQVSQPQSVGIATNGREVFMPIYAKNIIRVLDAATGKPLRELACPGPRGLTLAANGDLLAVSFLETPSVAQVVRFSRGAGTSKAVITQNLIAPWDVAVGEDGRIFVSDLGQEQQVKVFDASGKLLKQLGTKGGRAWQGRYNDKGFLRPSGLAIDARGDLMMTESAIPKVFNRLDAKTGVVKQRWFGAPVYWAATWPSIDDPRVIYTQFGGGFAQFTLPNKGDKDRPDIYWNLNEAGFPQSANFESGMAQPQWVRARNGHDYLVSDANPHTIALKVGDKLRPVAHFRGVHSGAQENKTGKNYLEIWIDAGGEGQMSPNEITRLDSVGGELLPMIADVTDSMQMEPNGDLYFMTTGNRILKIPARPLSKGGALGWNLAAASYPVSPVLPSKGDSMSYSWREGLHGARLDGSGNLYTIFCTDVGGGGDPYTYASPKLARSMKEGMGHTSRFDTVKFAKFDASGKMLWMAGRKATAAARPGEMYHFWNMAGLVNDRYIAAGSEWGQIYFYTHDGFFVDALMENPGLNPPPGPYTFGGETSGGRVQYFPRRDELWAYSSGMAYQVAGFKNGQVEGESRVGGTVALDRVYEAGSTAPIQSASPLQIVALNGDVFADANNWNAAPIATLSKGGEPLATAQIGYNAQFLFARIRVTDASPLQNAADTITTAFKGGDTAGIVLGPTGTRQQPGAGDVRFLVARVGGQTRLIAMKAVTEGEKRLESYRTPAAGEAKFEFVGEVPGGRATLTPDATGYTATFAVPRSFLEFDLTPGTPLSGDIEVRLSGNGPRGVQVTSRNYLFTPSTTATTMTDDVPTEARLYPEFWGRVEVK